MKRAERKNEEKKERNFLRKKEKKKRGKVDADSSAILEGRVSDGDGKRDCSNFAWMRRYDRDRV